MKITRVCISDSVHSLLLYLLISTEDEIKQTFFFFQDGIHESIRKKFPHHYWMEVLPLALSKTKKIKLHLKRILLHLSTLIRWQFLRTAEIYALDFLYISAPLIGKRRYIHIADGPNCFTAFPVTPEYKRITEKRIIDIPVRFLFGALWKKEYGISNQCMKIISTTPDRLVEHEGKENITVSLETLWKNASEEKKKLIFYIFDITKEELNNMKNRKNILLTQQLATEGTVTEEELIIIYRNLLKGIPEKELVIKRHPRDRVDYHKYFPQAFFYDKFAPMQILALEGVTFENAITIFSSSVYSFGKNTKVIRCGTSVHPNIEKAYGKQ